MAVITSGTDDIARRVTELGSRISGQGKPDDSDAATFEDGYRVAEMVGTIEVAAGPETVVPVTFRA